MPKKNRYSRLFGLLRQLAKVMGWGDDYLGLAIAEKKVKDHYKIKSFRRLSDEQLNLLVNALVKKAYTRQPGWPELPNMEKTQFNKVQINRVTKFGIDKNGNKISETIQMFNIRTNSVDEAIELYNELLEKFYKGSGNSKLKTN